MSIQEQGHRVIAVAATPSAASTRKNVRPGATEIIRLGTALQALGSRATQGERGEFASAIALAAASLLSDVNPLPPNWENRFS